MQSVQIVSPLVYEFQHSFEPNCYVDGCYMSHENMSFVDISTNKSIEPGEVLILYNFRN